MPKLTFVALFAARFLKQLHLCQGLLNEALGLEIAWAVDHGQQLSHILGRWIDGDHGGQFANVLDGENGTGLNRLEW